MVKRQYTQLKTFSLQKHTGCEYLSFFFCVSTNSGNSELGKPSIHDLRLCTTFSCISVGIRSGFLFFAAYVICKKNYSFSTVYSGVKFLFLIFFQCKTANSFYYSKLNDSSRVRTTAFSSSRFGIRVSVVPNIFTIYP